MKKSRVTMDREGQTPKPLPLVYSPHLDEETKAYIVNHYKSGSKRSTIARNTGINKTVLNCILVELRLGS